MSLASRISKSRSHWFSQGAAHRTGKAGAALGSELRHLPPHILQDIGIEPHLVGIDVAQNTFFTTFHA